MNGIAVTILHHVSLVVAYVGAAVILWGVVITAFRFVRCEIRRLRGEKSEHDAETLRHRFGFYLLIGLEFLIAADIIETIIQPTLLELAVLGSIVVIRTVISFSLNRELAEFHRRPTHH